MFSKIASTFNNALSVSKSSNNRPPLGENEEINLDSISTLKQQIQIVSKFITSFDPVTIPTPFLGADFKLSKQEDTLFFGSNDGRIAKLNLKTNTIDLDRNIDDSAIWTVNLSVDQRTIFIAGENPIVKAYDIASFELVARFHGHNSVVFQNLISPRGQYMYTASADCTVKEWDLTNCEGRKDIKDFKDIVRHKQPVRWIDLSTDGEILVSGGSDGKAFIVNTFTYEVIGELTTDTEIFAVRISEKKNFVVTGDVFGSIIVWKFGTWEVFKRFKDSGKINCIDIAESEEYLATGGESNNIVLWDLVQDRKRIELKGHMDAVKIIQICFGQTSIVSLGMDSKIKKWRVPIFESRNLIEYENPVTLLWFSNENGLLYAYSTSPNRICAWNLINYTKVKEIDIQEAEVKFYHKSADDKLFYVVYSENYCYILTSYDLITGERSKSQSIGQIEITSVCISNDGFYLFVGQTFKIQTFILPHDMELYNAQIYHIGVVNKIVCAPSRKFIISADNVNLIKMIDVELMADSDVRNDLEGIETFKKHEFKILDMILIGNDHLVVVSESLTLFWNIDKRSVVRKIENGNHHYVNVSLDMKYIFLRDTSRLEIWTAEDFSYKSFIQYEDKVDNFHISPDNRVVAMATEGNIIVQQSPVWTNKIYICGDISKKYDFIGYLSEVIADSSEKYKDGFDDWVIEPFHMNALHFYAYYNFDQYLVESLDKSAPFFCTAHGFSPLSIALEMDFPNCISAILRQIRVIFEKNRFIYFSLESTLSTLNNSGYERLHTLYNLMYSKTINKNLPKFCLNKPSFPVLVKSESFLPKKETFDNKIVFDEEGNSIDFFQTYLRVPILAGTLESIEFLQSIQDCKNKRIFATDFIQIYLEEKWKQVKWVSYLNALLYVLFIVLVSVYTVRSRNKDFLVYPFAVNAMFLFYELFYLVSSKKKYFSDVWNYVDIPRIAAFSIYAILIWTDVLADNDTFLAFLILIIWIRGVTYFRVYKPTRYLINLLITACKDVLAFLLIIFYSTISFALVFYALRSYDDDFFTYATTLYDLNLGNSNIEGLNELAWIFYVIVTVLNPIIMINLLISILGDTYGAVKEDVIMNDAQELISLILESELILFWRRTRTDKAFLHVCNETNPTITGSEDTMMKKIKNLKQRSLLIIKNLAIEANTIHSIGKTLTERNSTISELVEKYESKYGADHL